MNPKVYFYALCLRVFTAIIFKVPFMVTGGPVGCWEHSWNKLISQCSSARLAFGPPAHARPIATCPLVVAFLAPCRNGGSALPGSGTSIETAVDSVLEMLPGTGTSIETPVDIVSGMREWCKLPKVCSTNCFTKRRLHFLACGCCCRRRLLPLSPLTLPLL